MQPRLASSSHVFEDDLNIVILSLLLPQCVGSPRLVYAALGSGPGLGKHSAKNVWPVIINF